MKATSRPYATSTGNNAQSRLAHYAIALAVGGFVACSGASQNVSDDPTQGRGAGTSAQDHEPDAHLTPIDACATIEEFQNQAYELVLQAVRDGGATQDDLDRVHLEFPVYGCLPFEGGAWGLVAIDAAAGIYDPAAPSVALQVVVALDRGSIFRSEDVLIYSETEETAYEVVAMIDPPAIANIDRTREVPDVQFMIGTRNGESLWFDILIYRLEDDEVRRFRPDLNICTVTSLHELQAADRDPTCIGAVGREPAIIDVFDYDEDGLDDIAIMAYVHPFYECPYAPYSYEFFDVIAINDGAGAFTLEHEFATDYTREWCDFSLGHEIFPRESSGRASFVDSYQAIICARAWGISAEELMGELDAYCAHDATVDPDDECPDPICHGERPVLEILIHANPPLSIALDRTN